MRQLAFLILLFTAVACNNADNGKGADWKAVQDLMPPLKTPGGELRVTGSMEYGDPSGSPRLEKRSPQGFNPKILMLDVVPPTDAKGRKVVELTYTEGLQTEDQHTSVEVYYKGEKIADMKIEKVH
jgi:hypothetical protein